jgi:hypothetical protein
MNTRTSDPRDLADASLWPRPSRARRVTRRRVDPKPPPARPAYTVRLVIIAALVSAVSLVIVTTTRHDDASHAPMAFAAAPQADRTPQAGKAPGPDGIDHGAIAPDAPSASDAETVESSIAAYER